MALVGGKECVKQATHKAERLTRVIMFLALAISTGAALAERVDIKLVGQQGVHYFFTIPKSHAHDPKYLEDRARTFCLDKPICQVHFWQAGEASPRRFPLSDKEVATEIANFQQNKNTGLNRMLWSCKRIPAAAKSDCF